VRRFAEVEHEITVGWTHPKSAFLALLFHDAVYVAGAPDNEAKSAELARETIERTMPRAAIDTARVAHLIELTARHGKLTPASVDPDAALFLDCDLAILGADPATFDAYDAAIATEYPHVPENLYRAGRRAFLEGLLGMRRIFLSDFFHGRYDGAARANLARAIARLA
jgi:predicted metal-dependent HD superfamily phosphohydrolase